MKYKIGDKVLYREDPEIKTVKGILVNRVDRGGGTHDLLLVENSGGTKETYHMSHMRKVVNEAVYKDNMKSKLKIIVEEYREMYEDSWTSNGTILIELFEALYRLIEEESDD